MEAQFVEETWVESTKGRTSRPGERVMNDWEFNGVAVEWKSRSS